MTSDFAPEVAKYPQPSPPNPQIAQNGDLDKKETPIAHSTNIIHILHIILHIIHRLICMELTSQLHSLGGSRGRGSLCLAPQLVPLIPLHVHLSFNWPAKAQSTPFSTPTFLPCNARIVLARYCYRKSSVRLSVSLLR